MTELLELTVLPLKDLFTKLSFVKRPKSEEILLTH